MKIYGSLLALSAISSVSGFVAHEPFGKISSSLSMSDKKTDAGTSYASKSYENLKTSFFTEEDSKSMKNLELEKRMDALEQGYDQGYTSQSEGGDYSNGAERIWASATEVPVQGGSLKTWSFPSPLVESVKVVLKTEGRPLNADVDLWQGPDNTPVKMRVYLEDGETRPFCASVQTPRGPNTIAIRNTGHLEFPLTAGVVASPESEAALNAARTNDMTIQGGALKTFPFDPVVQSVQVLLKTDGRPLNARIELLQGPNNNKQVVELYTEDGMERPFYMVIETPGSGNVVRVLNTAPVEFPMSALVTPYDVSANRMAGFEPVIGGDNDWF